MSCSAPLKGFKFGKTAKGKDNYIITPYECNHIEIRNGKPIKCFDRGISANADYVISEFIEIPCGHCIGCRLEYSRQWANRCLLEMKEHENNCFITLTYDDDHLPMKWFSKLKDKKEYLIPTLVKRDLQLFIKRLRKELDKENIKIRFFACGEYGDNTFRPHYHCIIFGWKPDNSDLSLVTRTNLGYNLYSSTLLSKLWPYGFNTVADATWETCAYVARYVTKKVNGKLSDNFYFQNALEKEFVTMSNRPGIGFDYYFGNSSDKNSYAIFLEDYIKTDFGSRKISNVRYFDKKLEELDPVLMKSLKETRKEFNKSKQKLKQKNTSLPYLKQLKVEENALKDKTKVFKRGEI